MSDVPPRAARLFDAAWFLVCAAVSSAWCLTAASQLSATFDEPIYVRCGLERWRTGSTAELMRLGTMPLPIDVETLPLALWERVHGAPLDPVGRLDRLLPWARASALVFWWLLLFYAGRAARSLGGPWAGRLAVALIAVEPTFLANAALSTTDIAITACLLALVYHFRAGRDGPWLRRVGWPALWFAAAVLAKASGLVFGGLCLVVVEAERRLNSMQNAECRMQNERGGLPFILHSAFCILHCLRRPAERGTFRGDLTQIVLLGMAVVFVYCGSDWKPQASALAWARQLPDGLGRTSMVGLFEQLRVFPNAGEAIARQVTHNLRGAGAYILGATDPRALWYYFPVAVSIKFSEPLLLGPVLLLALRPRSLRNWAALCALALLVFSLNAHVQAGVRFMLPLAALAVVGVAAAAVHAARSPHPHPPPQGGREKETPPPPQGGREKETPPPLLRGRVGVGGWRARAIAAACVAAVVWSGAASWAAWPNGLCYVNRLWGDPADGDRLVSEANWDWGQGLKELTRWQRRHGQGPLDVWYFGLDPSVGRPPLRPFPLQDLPLTRPGDVAGAVQGRRLAVSTTLVHGCLALAPPAAQVAQDFLATQRPVARTSTFLIYDFTAK